MRDAAMCVPRVVFRGVADFAVSRWRHRARDVIRRHSRGSHAPQHTLRYRDRPMRREPLRGRDRERLALVAALDAAIAGHGAVAMISGPAGIGKSALAETLASEVEDRGLSVIRGRAWEFADAPPYFPVGPALRAL